jgi:hypothetical protein
LASGTRRMTAPLAGLNISAVRALRLACGLPLIQSDKTGCVMALPHMQGLGDSNKVNMILNRQGAKVTEKD